MREYYSFQHIFSSIPWYRNLINVAYLKIYVLLLYPWAFDERKEKVFSWAMYWEAAVRRCMFDSMKLWFEWIQNIHELLPDSLIGFTQQKEAADSCVLYVCGCACAGAFFCSNLSLSLSWVPLSTVDNQSSHCRRINATKLIDGDGIKGCSSDWQKLSDEQKRMSCSNLCDG